MGCPIAKAPFRQLLQLLELLVRAFLLFNCSANAFFSSSEVAKVNKVVRCCQSFFFSTASPFSFLVQVFLLFWCQSFFFFSGASLSSLLSAKIGCKNILAAKIFCLLKYFDCKNILAAKIIWLHKYVGCRPLLTIRLFFSDPNRIWPTEAKEMPEIH